MGGAEEGNLVAAPAASLRPSAEGCEFARVVDGTAEAVPLRGFVVGDKWQWADLESQRELESGYRLHMPDFLTVAISVAATLTAQATYFVFMKLPGSLKRS